MDRRAFIPTYVISLADAEARRRNMTARLAAAGIPFRFFDAVDGRSRQLPETIDGARVVRMRFGTEAVAGCAASHRLLHRMVAEGEADTVLILEDDAVVSDDFVEVVENALAFEFDVFKLEGSNVSKRQLTVGRVGRYEVIITSRPSIGAIAYLLRRDAAWRICGLPILDQASDYVFQDTRLRLRVLEMNPFCAWQDPATETQLQHSPNATYIPENQWAFRRFVESTRRKLLMGAIYGPVVLARFELQRLRPVRPGLAIFRWSIFLAVVIALIAGVWLYW